MTTIQRWKIVQYHASAHVAQFIKAIALALVASHPFTIRELFHIDYWNVYKDQILFMLYVVVQVTWSDKTSSGASPRHLLAVSWITRSRSGQTRILGQAQEAKRRRRASNEVIAACIHCQASLLPQPRPKIYLKLNQNVLQILDTIRLHCSKLSTRDLHHTSSR